MVIDLLKIMSPVRLPKPIKTQHANPATFAEILIYFDAKCHELRFDFSQRR